ncbi:MAG: branched-chain amino acid transport system II carrier protein [Parachlamydiaceae bacterium]|nr:branched-chain amino acid transport system II carrier protein [Parachlamydiaceae bacterium]
MNKIINLKAISIGLAMFSMFFGAGNIIYPLAVGQYAGDKNIYAMLGLILTAAIMPIAGVIAMLLFNGNYRQFFGRLGRIPGFILALTIISLLGPLGSTPRCIALSYITLKSSFLDMSLPVFSALACSIIFLFTLKKKHILALLAWVLTPILLISLIIIVIIGLITAPEAHSVDSSNLKIFFHGLKEGYNTMDLLAAFFFSSTIINILKAGISKSEATKENYLNTAFQASVIAVCLLAAIYVGFSYIASFHGSDLLINGKEELLAAITMKIAGPYAGILVCLAIALACLTTAIALISAFTDFIQREVFEEKVSYEFTLIGALLVTFFVSTFEFTGISAFLWPILQICYPALIVLTFLNIAHRVTGLKILKLPVLLSFACSVIIYLAHT